MCSIFEVGKLPWAWVDTLMEYWQQFPPMHEVGRLDIMGNGIWKPRDASRSGSGDSTTPEEVQQFAARAGIPAGNLNHMPPHLRACLESARAQVASGKVN